MTRPPTRRRIAGVHRKAKATLKESPSQRATRTAVRYIMDNVHYKEILEALRAGTPDGLIAEHFIARGVFDIQQKTAITYLRAFRRAQPELCKAREDVLSGYDNLFSGIGALADPETELVKAIKLQKARIGIAFGNERNVNLLMQGTGRDIKELRELIMELARLRGIVGRTMDINFTNYGESVREDLKGIQQDEGQRDAVAVLMADLAKGMNDA